MSTTTALLAALGRPARRLAGELVASLRLVGLVWRGAAVPAPAMRPLQRRVIAEQLAFTFTDAAVVLAVAAALTGAALHLALRAQAERFGLSPLVGRELSLVLVRDIAPLLAAVVVLARSGAPVAADVATQQADGELVALDALGVDIAELLLAPRVVGIAIATAMAALFATLTAFAADVALASLAGTASAQVLRESITPRDLLAVFTEGGIAGLAVAFTCLGAGLRAAAAPDIPRVVRIGSVRALVLILTVHAVAVAVRVW